MKIKHIYRLITAIVACQLAGVIGSLFTMSSVSTWYQTLNMPALSPPSWVFGPAWITLYFLMGVSLFLVWQKGWKKKKVKVAMKVFGVSLALNALWSIFFFGMQNPGLALIDIVLLWITILASIILFHKISKPASYLLIPYILWVSFATYLNYAIWVIN